MNRNYFVFTKNELWFLVMCQNMDRIIGYNDKMPDWNIEQLEVCTSILRQKKCLIVNEGGEMEVDSRLDSWMYVVTHPQGFFRAISSNDEIILLFFYGETIVSLHIENDICELIWLPFIHLAFGQISGILKTKQISDWRFSVGHHKDNKIEEYTPSSNEDLTDVINNISKSLLAIHRYAIMGEER